MIEDSLQPQISLFKGLTFSFRDGDQIIVLHASNFTGKELVTVNGTVVSESRGFSRHTHHVFDVNGHAYRITLQSMGILSVPCLRAMTSCKGILFAITADHPQEVGLVTFFLLRQGSLLVGYTLLILFPSGVWAE